MWNWNFACNQRFTTYIKAWATARVYLVNSDTGIRGGHLMQTQYMRSTQLFNNGTPTSDAIKASSLPKSICRDEDHRCRPVQPLPGDNDNKDATELLKVCKVTLMEELFVGIAKDLKKSGDLL